MNPYCNSLNKNLDKFKFYRKQAPSSNLFPNLLQTRKETLKSISFHSQRAIAYAAIETDTVPYIRNNF